MLHLTTLLVLFAAAAFKSDHTALLAATLVSEAHTVFFLSRRLQVPVVEGRALLVPATHLTLSTTSPFAFVSFTL